MSSLTWQTQQEMLTAVLELFQCRYGHEQHLNMASKADAETHLICCKLPALKIKGQL